MDQRLSDLNGIFTANAKAIIEAQSTGATLEAVNIMQQIRNDTIIFTNFIILARELLSTDKLKEMAATSVASIEANIAMVDDFVKLSKETGLLEV